MLKRTAFIFLFIFPVVFPACSAKRGGVVADSGGSGGLRCNLYVIDVMKEKKVYLPSSSANDIDVYLKKSDKWAKIPRTAKGKLDHEAAYCAARDGKYVLATYNGGAKNGHVAIINGTKAMTHSKGYGAYVPYAQGSVQGRKPELLPLSYQFSSDKEPKVSYFVYKY